MMNIFSIPQNDQSIYFLGQIFGYVSDVYPVSNAPLLLGVMFKTLNTTALVLGAMLVVHTTIMGLLKTAAEGEFLGRQWNSLWVPLRIVIGIASLFPTATGYSILQVILMWVIVQGIGAADTLWTAVLNYVNIAGSPFAAIQIPGIKVQQDMQQLFQSISCQAQARVAAPLNHDQTPFYYCSSQYADSTFCGRPIEQLIDVKMASIKGDSPNSLKYVMGPKGACGTLTYGDPDTDPSCKNQDAVSQLTCQSLKAQQAAIIAIVPLMHGVAQSFVEADTQYLSYSLNQSSDPSKVNQNPLLGRIGAPATGVEIPTWLQDYCSASNIASAACVRGSGSLPDITGNDTDWGNTSDAAADMYWRYYMQPVLGGPQDFIGASKNLYLNSIVAAVTQWITSQPPSRLSGWQQEAQGLGWITAGSYYYRMAESNNNNLSAAMPSITIATPNPTPAKGTDNELSPYRNNYSSIRTVITTLVNQNAKNNSLTNSLPPQASQVGAMFTGSGSDILQSFMGSLTGGRPGEQVTNPLSSLQAFGHQLVTIAEILFFTFLSIAVVVVAVVGIRVFALGTGEIDSVSQALMMMFFILLPLLLAFISALFVFGGMLAVYTPLIPYVIYTFGAIGWITATIEAMVAAPFVALGILSPGGQHEILGRAEPSVMILLNIFLRPSLMVFGMMTAMLMAGVVVTMINAGFKGVMYSINSSPGLAELILFIAAYTFLIIAALNKCFALIYMIPSRVLMWIGGQQISYGEEEGLSAVKAGSEGAAGKVAAGAAGGLQLGGQAQDKMKGYADKKKAEGTGDGGGTKTTLTPSSSSGSGSAAGGEVGGGSEAKKPSDK